MNEVAATSKPRGWGQIHHREGRPGFSVRFTHDAKQYERRGFTTWGAADKARRKARTLIEAGTPIADVLAACFGDDNTANMTFRAASEHYMAHAKARKRDSTLTSDAFRFRVLNAAPWAGKRLSAITPSDLLAWIEKRQEPRTRERRRKRRADETIADYRKATDKRETVSAPGASGPTMNRALALVSSVYKWAQRLGYVESNPARRVDRFAESKGREVYLTAGEARALIDACSPMLRPAVLLAFSTGMRRGELLALRWRCVDLVRKEIRVEAATEKAGRGRTVPLTAEAVATLKALKDARPLPALDASDAVLVLGDGKPLPVTALRSMFDRTVTGCQGIPLDKREAVSFHALRHSAASLMVAAGVPVLDVARVLGHSTLAVTMRYAHFAPESGRRAADALGKALNVAAAKPEAAKAPPVATRAG